MMILEPSQKTLGAKDVKELKKFTVLMIMTAYFLENSCPATIVSFPLNENNLGAVLLLPLHLLLTVSVTVSDIASANFLSTGRS